MTQPFPDVREIKTARDFERVLRALGFSRYRAKLIASIGWRNAQPERQRRPASLARLNRKPSHE